MTDLTDIRLRELASECRAPIWSNGFTGEMVRIDTGELARMIGEIERWRKNSDEIMPEDAADTTEWGVSDKRLEYLERGYGRYCRVTDDEVKAMVVELIRFRERASWGE
jgi:hypothetical protein